MGAWYHLTGSVSIQAANQHTGLLSYSSEANKGGILYGSTAFYLNNSGWGHPRFSVSIKFQAASDTMFVYFQGNTYGNLNGNGTKDLTFLQLEKLTR